MEAKFLSQLIAKAGANPIPLWGQFELLPVCNLNCSMCYVHNPKSTGQSLQNLLPASFWINIAQQAVEYGMLVLSLTGGETILYPELDILLDELSRMGLLISLNTNGTLIDERIADTLAKHHLAKINLSLYGGSDDTYKKITGCPDGFTRVSRAIELLKASDQNVYLNGVLTPDNWQDLPKMLKFGASHGLALHETSYIFPKREPFDGYDSTTARPSPEKAAAIRAYYLRLVQGENQFRKNAALAVYRDKCMASLPECPPRKHECRAGRYEFAVNWKGKMQPCILFSGISENLQTESFIEAWEKCNSRMSKLPFPENCITCIHLENCMVCQAAVYLETGTITEAPEYLCRYTEEQLRIWKKASTGLRVEELEATSLPQEIGFRGCEN